MHIERGSTWNRWDFHVHTPYSILKNDFGFNPDPECKTDIVQFDDYVRILFTKAVEKGIVAIGITDYFSIDGYKRIRQEYLDKPVKMAELFPDEELRAEILRIYVFPNIELRLDTFVGNDDHSVNYHVLFSGDIDCNIIEERFLHSLKINHQTGTELPINRTSITQIGSEYKYNNPKETRDDYLVGLEKAAIHHDKIIDVLKKSTDLAEKFFLSIPVDEDLSKLTWEGRYSETRRLLYHQCHFLMSSNAGTRKFALAEGHEEDQKKEFGSIKPCIWGSDAHSYDKLFCPDQDRYCWVKAEPTFEGLRQILYEPADRVRIQKDRPEGKDEHQLIDYIRFYDNRFAEEPIYISEGLTAIIGGKSTGKSILLRHIAQSIDAKQVQDKEKQQRLYTGTKLEASAEVVWRDGVSGGRKIIYIPQSWLNRVVDESGSDTQLNALIRDILLQQPSVFSAHKTLKEKVSEIIATTKRSIEDYVSHVEKARECENQLNEFGRSVAFSSSIHKLEKQREVFSAEAGVTDEILEEYGALEKQITEQSELLSAIQEEEPKIDFVNNPYLYIPGITIVDFDGSHSYDFSGIPTVGTLLEQTIEHINTAILEIWTPALQMYSELLADKKKGINENLTKLNANYVPLKRIVVNNDQLKKIDNQLKEERQRLQKATELERVKDEHLSQAEKLKTQILSSRQKLFEIYEEFSGTISELNGTDTDLVFLAEIEVNRKELFDAINGLFDNRNLRAFRDSGYSVTDEDTLKIDDGLFATLWNGVINGTLGFKGGANLQSALEKLFSDWFYVHFIVSSGNDTINSMSPGKKALVLLELIVSIEKGKCPILIDQPEDDLDNRSIYTDLVKYLRDKKHDRQIIIVTHNANVVLGADAEEVIIANQEGKESENYSKRFEYRCGPIENISPIKESDGTIRKGVLNQKGIQEQICDILEGGKAAFEKRASKYFGTT